jgi:hypothetical protein
MNDTPKFQNGFFRSNLFIFLMGQVVTVLCGLVFFGVAWGRLSQQFTESMEWRARTDAQITRMDSIGPNASRYGVESLKLIAEQTDERLKYLEEQTRKIDVMKEKIDRVEGDVRNLQGIKR